MSDAFSATLHPVVRWVAALALLLGSGAPAFARQLPPSAGAEALVHYDVAGDARSLQQLLALLGYYERELTGEWDEATAGALQAFQADHRLPATGELDPATLEALGGPAERLNDRPRFRYLPGAGESLAGVAERFGSTLPWIARFNPGIASLDEVAPGVEIVVPVRFPLPPGLRADRVEVLPGRFLGTYLSDTPFAAVGQLAEEMTALLEESGFAVEPAATPMDGVTLRGNGVVLGRIVFSASPASGSSRVHLALLFLQHEEFEHDIEAGAWIRPGSEGRGEGTGESSGDGDEAEKSGGNSGGGDAS